MLAQQQVWPDRIRPLRRVEYESLVEHGLLADSRVELLLGALVDMSPQGPFHAEIVRRLSERLIRQLPAGVHTRVQSPLALSVDSEPEPDIAVVPDGNYTSAHPTTAVLVIEVADSSLPKDRGVKAALYATSGIEDFWLVDLSAKTVEVHRLPAKGRYARIEHVDVNGTLVPLDFFGVRIPVGELFA